MALTDEQLVIEEFDIANLPNEYYRIKWTVDSITRYFEILSAEDIQDRGILTIMTCKESR